MNVGIADLNDDDHPDIYISNLASLVKGGKYTFPDVNTPVDFDLRAMAGMLIKESDILYMSRLEEGPPDRLRALAGRGARLDVHRLGLGRGVPRLRPRRRRRPLPGQRHERLQHLLDGLQAFQPGRHEDRVSVRLRPGVERLLSERRRKAQERLSPERRRFRRELAQHRLPGSRRRRRPGHRGEQLPREGGRPTQRLGEARAELAEAPPRGRPGPGQPTGTPSARGSWSSRRTGRACAGRCRVARAISR